MAALGGALVIARTDASLGDEVAIGREAADADADRNELPVHGSIRHLTFASVSSRTITTSVVLERA
jgi:hypothetical protein